MARKLAVLVCLFGACALLHSSANSQDNPLKAILLFQGPRDTSYIGYHINPIGDINGDGFGDVAISCKWPRGTFILYGGNPANNAPDMFIRGIGGAQQPIDFTGDGINDVILTDSGKLFVYQGYGDSISSYPIDSVIPVPNMLSFSTYIKAAYVDSDRLGDILTNYTNNGMSAIGFVKGANLHSGEFDWSYIQPDIQHDIGSCDFIDFNGDGYLDICMGAPADKDSVGYIFIFLGPNFKTQPDIRIARPGDIVLDFPYVFGWNVKNIGDFNGDGQDDMAVDYGSNGPKFLIYLCGPHADTLDDYRLVDGADDIAGVGDINGDGYDDLACGGSGVWQGMVFTYLGGPHADSICDGTITDNDIPPASIFDIGWQVSPAGDFNGDGLSDFMFSCRNLLHDQWGDVYIMAGSRDIINDTKYENASVRFMPFDVRQNYPNPFNPSTTIEFSLPRAGYTELKIYNLLGQLIASPVQQNLPTGDHRAEWDGKDQSGNPTPTGVYLYKITSGPYVSTKKMVLLK